MLPTNSHHAKQHGCSPVSSNCVIWNGPDLDCIGLCKGDTISDVVYQIATELCTIIEQLDLSNYDLTCFTDCPTPEDYKGLIQLLIDKICAINNVSLTETGSSSTDLSTVIVAIAECFYYVNSTGDTVTSMSLLDYVTAIGNKLCEDLGKINVIESSLSTTQTDVSVNQVKIANLEANKADTDSFQYQNSIVLDPTGATKFITDAVRTIEDSYVAHLQAMGTVSEVYLAIQKGEAFNSKEQLSQLGAYGSSQGWISTLQNIADSLNNLWLIQQDQYNAITDIKSTYSAGGCNDITYNFRAFLNTNSQPSVFVDMYFDGSLGLDGFRDADPLGSLFTIKDALGNSSTSRINVVATSENSNGFRYQIDTTPVDSSLDLTITVYPNVYKEINGTTCYSEQTYVIPVTAICPVMTLVPAVTSINYSFIPTPGYTYTVNLYDAGGTIPIATNTYVPSSSQITDDFTGLIAVTNYELEITFVNTAGDSTICVRQGATTIASPCVAPVNVITQIIL